MPKSKQKKKAHRKTQTSPQRIHLLDLGCGRDAERARETAIKRQIAGKPGKVIAIDPLADTSHAHRQIPNLEIHSKEVEKALKDIPSASADWINFDLSLMTKKAFEEAQKQFPNPPAHHVQIIASKPLMNHLKRVLHPTGQITFHGSEHMAGELVPHFERAGFDVTVQPLTQENVGYVTPSMLEHPCCMDCFYAQSKKLVARKKKA